MSTWRRSAFAVIPQATMLETSSNSDEPRDREKPGMGCVDGHGMVSRVARQRTHVAARKVAEAARQRQQVIFHRDQLPAFACTEFRCEYSTCTAPGYRGRLAKGMCVAEMLGLLNGRLRRSGRVLAGVGIECSRGKGKRRERDHQRGCVGKNSINDAALRLQLIGSSGSARVANAADRLEAPPPQEAYIIEQAP